MVDKKIELDSGKKFVCKYCNKEFNDGRKLGGHISRSHPFAKYSSRSEIEASEDSDSNSHHHFQSFKKK